MDRRRIVGQVLLLILLIAAFWYGSQADNPVSKIAWPAGPTPTPDGRSKMGEEVTAGDLKLWVVDAVRVVRPEAREDLGIITVRFGGTSDCDDEAGNCRFDTTKFSLVDEAGNAQKTSLPPNKYIQGLQVLQLVTSRELSKLTTEEGQIYFTLNRPNQGYTLKYLANDGSEVRVYIEPRQYTFDEVIKNLTTTPNPYKKVEDSK